MVTFLKSHRHLLSGGRCLLLVKPVMRAEPSELPGHGCLYKLRRRPMSFSPLQTVPCDAPALLLLCSDVVYFISSCHLRLLRRPPRPPVCDSSSLESSCCSPGVPVCPHSCHDLCSAGLSTSLCSATLQTFTPAFAATLPPSPWCSSIAISAFCDFFTAAPTPLE